MKCNSIVAININ